MVSKLGKYVWISVYFDIYRLSMCSIADLGVICNDYDGDRSMFILHVDRYCDVIQDGGLS